MVWQLILRYERLGMNTAIVHYYVVGFFTIAIQTNPLRLSFFYLNLRHLLGCMTSRTFSSAPKLGKGYTTPVGARLLIVRIVAMHDGVCQ